MYLAVDGTTRWEAMKKGFFDLLDSLPAEVEAGIEMFPRGDAPVTCCAITSNNDIDCSACLAGELPGPEARCQPSLYTSPPVGIAPLTGSHPAAIKSAVISSDDEFYWATPMAPALEGAIAYMNGKGYGGISSVILLTDGNPTSCETAADPGANNIQRVVDAAAAGFGAANPIRTFVLGVVDGDQGVLGASEANLSRIAAAGGTARFPGCDATSECAYAVNTGNFTGDLGQALDAIALQAFSCTFDLPAVEGGKPDYESLNLTLTTDAKTMTIPRDTSHASGWDYLPGNQQVQLYGDSCTVMKADASAKIEVVLGCDTVGQ
jgi:hypothetical protein